LIDDDFTTRDETTWKWADHGYVSQFAPGYYLKNHSEVNAALTLGEGQGMILTMSNEPCHWNKDANCKGADMASSHVQTRAEHSYGDYEARFRAPHIPGDYTCPDGIYGYFTAGYSKHDGIQNEMNFGLHPDRDNNGTVISCESHADTGKYRETKVPLGFNYRAGFHTYILRLRPTYVEWIVDGKSVHKVEEKLSHTMHTSFILRTSKAGEMPTVIMEWKHFKFTPYNADVEEAALV
jgi:beta-glucanase (GH16 family)